MNGAWKGLIVFACAASVIALGMSATWSPIREQRAIISKVIGISAICNDGMYSTSRRDRGTCSGHGGVKEWIIK